MEIENRGSDDVPFGYVYINEKTRLGFTCISNSVEVWNSRGWNHATSSQIDGAITLLRETFPCVNVPERTIKQ